MTLAWQCLCSSSFSRLFIYGCGKQGVWQAPITLLASRSFTVMAYNLVFALVWEISRAQNFFPYFSRIWSNFQIRSRFRISDIVLDLQDSPSSVSNKTHIPPFPFSWFQSRLVTNERSKSSNSQVPSIGLLFPGTLDNWSDSDIKPETSTKKIKSVLNRGAAVTEFLWPPSANAGYRDTPPLSYPAGIHQEQ